CLGCRSRRNRCLRGGARKLLLEALVLLPQSIALGDHSAPVVRDKVKEVVYLVLVVTVAKAGLFKPLGQEVVRRECHIRAFQSLERAQITLPARAGDYSVAIMFATCIRIMSTINRIRTDRSRDTCPIRTGFTKRRKNFTGGSVS